MATFMCRHQRFRVSRSTDNDDNGVTYYHSTDGKFNATFIFSCEYFVNEWVLPEEDAAEPVFLGRTALPCGPEIYVNLDEHQYFNVKTLIGIVNEQLHRWPLRTNLFYRLMLRDVIPEAREAYTSMPSSCNAMRIYFPVTIVHDHVYDEMRDMDMTILRSEEEATTYMVPAAQWAIESLKRVELAADSANQCVICFEEMIKGGDKAMAIPCSHVFHEDCIKQWFSTSHYCPLCRFEMPISCSSRNES